MGRNRSACAGLALSILGLLCAGVLSACLNPIPDDFPNGNDRQLDEDTGAAPDSAHPGSPGSGVTPGASSGSGSGDQDPAPSESPERDGNSAPVNAAPDAGASVPDAGAEGGTGG